MTYELSLLIAFVLSLSFLGTLAMLGGGVANLKRLRKSGYLPGVCSGLGETTQVPTWLWRTVFVLLAFCGGIGVLIYLLLCIFLPRFEADPQPAHSQAAPTS